MDGTDEGSDCCDDTVPPPLSLIFLSVRIPTIRAHPWQDVLVLSEAVLAIALDIRRGPTQPIERAD